MSTHSEKKEMKISVCRFTILTAVLIFILLRASLFSNKLDAQTTSSGDLTGVVSDPSGAVVPDAIVELKDNAKGDCAYRKSHSAVFTNVTLLHCAQNLPQYQFARDRYSIA